jgi:hypothetical protein
MHETGSVALFGSNRSGDSIGSSDKADTAIAPGRHSSKLRGVRRCGFVDEAALADLMGRCWPACGITRGSELSGRTMEAQPLATGLQLR